MKAFIQTLKNIYKIEELRSRILFTLGILLVYRLCTVIVLPGIDPSGLAALKSQTSEGIMGLLDMFSGGAFANASIVALGIMPYITASILVQLLGIMIPSFQKMQREGESGRRKINQITRYLTVVILIFQGAAYLINLKQRSPAAFSPNFNVPLAVIILIAGTMFIMWLGEKITDKGIGNGISLIIMIGIIARLPQALVQEFAVRLEGQGGGVALLVELVAWLIVIGLSVGLVQGTRKIPVQYAKRIVGNRQYGGVRQYIPLKVNAAGVMPIIFAQALMFIPVVLAGYASSDEKVSSFTSAFLNMHSFWYNLVFGLLIVAFTYFYTAITINPNQMAEDMKRNGGFIPGVKPGKKTIEYLYEIMSRLVLPGSIFLALIAIFPTFAALLGIKGQFAQFFGGTTLLIMVGVVLDTLQQIESHLLMRHYDGLMKTGRIKGRSSI
ncbi:MAG: preprotein translocase subunit SecY [Bacteroidales bacterium]|nr:preprotein translocase subunit SecY [Bacteroidales bacterium]